MFCYETFRDGDEPFAMHRGDACRLLETIPDASIDAIVTDPPYGIALKLGTRGKRRNSIAGDGRLEARRLWRRFVPQLARIAKPNTAHLVFGSWKSPWMHAVLSRWFNVKGCIVWNKRIIGLGHYLRPQWELAYFCTKGKPPRLGTAPPDVWEQARIIRTEHPCEKPVPLLRRAIGLVAPIGATVLDPFAGVASSGVAAVLEGRRFIGFEIDQTYARLGRRRLLNAIQERQ